jgi:hypothetical protein
MSCISQKRNQKSDNIITLNAVVNKNFIFTFNISNNSKSHVLYYKCFSIQEIELNKNLLFSFSIVDRVNKKIHLEKNFINYNTSDCLKKIDSNKMDSLSFDLKLFLKNIENVDFKLNDILVEVFIVYMTDKEKKTLQDSFIINPFK